MKGKRSQIGALSVKEKVSLVQRTIVTFRERESKSLVSDTDTILLFYTEVSGDSLKTFQCLLIWEGGVKV